MQTRNIDVCLINQTDEFQNEFLPTYSQRLQWLTNFSGSAGEAIITMSKAYLFVDGRYTLQAKNEVNKNIYKVYNYTEKTPTEILKSFKFNLSITKAKPRFFIRKWYCPFNTKILFWQHPKQSK